MKFADCIEHLRQGGRVRRAHMSPSTYIAAGKGTNEGFWMFGNIIAGVELETRFNLGTTVVFAEDFLLFGETPS